MPVEITQNIRINTLREDIEQLKDEIAIMSIDNYKTNRIVLPGALYRSAKELTRIQGKVISMS